MFYFYELFCFISSLIHDHEEKSFINHMRKNSLIYNSEEYHFRLGICLMNQRYVNEFNRQSDVKGFRLEMNLLSTLTPFEYKVLLGFKGSASPDGLKNARPVIPKKGAKDGYPLEWDWNSKGKIQIVKYQGTCGSCWSFGAIAAQESMYAVYFNQLFNLSEQNLVDCDFFDYGFDGGDFFSAWYYVQYAQEGNFVTQDSYHYTSVKETCKYEQAEKSIVMLVAGYLAQNTEEDLLGVIYENNPFACAIDASHDSFQLYQSGIYYNPGCSSDIPGLDHAVLTVGWGSDKESGKDYWIVKNSWSEDWVEKGYIRMSRNRDNNCGIAIYAGTSMIYYY
jgi:cathepsin L